MTTTIDRTTQYEALSREQQWHLLGGGIIVGLPIQCEYCDEPAAWSSADGARATIACFKPQHIAYSESWGAEATVEDCLPIIATLREYLNRTGTAEQAMQFVVAIGDAVPLRLH